MRRTDLELKNISEITAILDQCETVRVGMIDGDKPYVIPISFGYEVIDEKIVMYIHGASRGKKYELLQKNGNVGVEADKFFQYKTMGKNITCNFDSVMGQGVATELTDNDKKIHALEKVVEHCGYKGFGWDYDVVSVTGVFKIEFNELTAKSKHD